MTDQQYDVITLGETMLRMAPPPRLRLEQADTLGITYGGAESNVAINLARLGRRVAWWSRLPDNPLGRGLVRTLHSHDVATPGVVFAHNERMGLYFVEFGAAPRGIKVWYDRRDSAASKMQPDDLPANWVERGRWLHLTGISPALGQSCADTVQHAVKRAQAAGLTVSFDVNYRALLWSHEDAAASVESLCHAADVVLVAQRDAANLFGVTGNIEAVAQKLHERWGGKIAVTGGADGAAGCDGDRTYFAPTIDVEIVDRLGAGDAFASGIIDRLLDGESLADALRFGTALAALKLTIAGDVALVSRAEVEAILNQTGNQLHR